MRTELTPHEFVDTFVVPLRIHHDFTKSLYGERCLIEIFQGFKDFLFHEGILERIYVGGSRH